MTPDPRKPGGERPVRVRRRPRWPRSLQARLVAIYTAAAVLLGLAGLSAFTVLLHRGVLASIDASLQSRIGSVVDQVRATGVPTATPQPAGSPVGQAGNQNGPQDGPGPVGSSAIDSFAAVYRPDGRLALIQPSARGPGPLSSSVLASATTGQHHFTLPGGDQELRVLTEAVTRPDGTWIVAVGTDLADVTRATNRAISALEITLPALIVLAALGAWLLSGAALRPVERMRADAASFGERDPANRITVPSTADELASLARTFNALLDRLTRSLSRQRELIADAGHELRTPLAVLRTELELADTPNRNRDDLAESIAHARSELERLSKVADDLLFLARADAAGPLIQPADIDLVDVAAEAVRAHQARAGLLGESVSLTAPDRLAARGDPAALRRALDNVIGNALTAAGPGGEITVELAGTPDGPTITVSDTGPGFPPEFIAHAFGRFTRPDHARSGAHGGAGLGLAIVAEIVNAHAGTVTARNNAAGAQVLLTLPATGPSAGSHRRPMSTIR